MCFNVFDLGEDGWTDTVPTAARVAGGEGSRFEATHGARHRQYIRSGVHQQEGTTTDHQHDRGRDMVRRILLRSFPYLGKTTFPLSFMFGVDTV